MRSRFACADTGGATSSAQSGLRRGELFKLRWRNVDLDRAQIKVLASKANKTRTVALPPSAVRLLRNWRDTNKIVDLQGHVFLNPETRKALVDIKRSWRTLCKRAKVLDFRFHDCRHDYASNLVMRGVDLYVVRDLLGHSSIALTERYAHLHPSAHADAVKLLG